MRYTVTKEYSFDSAHRLVRGYKGKCANVHGHTWRVRISLRAGGLDPFGFVRDYADFKPVKEWIDEALDHACMVAPDDVELRTFLAANGQKMFVMDEGNPTSENLARTIFRKAESLLFHKIHAVEINETCTSCARYEE